MMHPYGLKRFWGREYKRNKGDLGIRGVPRYIARTVKKHERQMAKLFTKYYYIYY